MYLMMDECQTNVPICCICKKPCTHNNWMIMQSICTGWPNDFFEWRSICACCVSNITQCNDMVQFYQISRKTIDEFVNYPYRIELFLGHNGSSRFSPLPLGCFRKQTKKLKVCGKDVILVDNTHNYQLEPHVVRTDSKEPIITVQYKLEDPQ